MLTLLNVTGLSTKGFIEILSNVLLAQEYGVIAMSKLISQIRNLKSVLLSKMSRIDAIVRFAFSKSQCRHAIGNADYQSHIAGVQLII